MQDDEKLVAMRSKVCVVCRMPLSGRMVELPVVEEAEVPVAVNTDGVVVDSLKFLKRVSVEYGHLGCFAVRAYNGEE